MPRRLPVRPAKVFGNFFVLIVLMLMSLIYYVHTFVVWIPRAKGKFQFILKIDQKFISTIHVSGGNRCSDFYEFAIFNFTK